MITTITRYGLAAGLIIGSILFGTTVLFHDRIPDATVGMAIGYTGMLLGFAMIFIGVKRHRDTVLGGVIGFGPALVMGLGITVIAGLCYVLAWEAALAVTGADFGADYAAAMIADAAATGDAATLAAAKADAAAFQAQYARPIQRMAITATEIVPVGALVSVIVAFWLSRRSSSPKVRA